MPRGCRSLKWPRRIKRKLNQIVGEILAVLFEGRATPLGCYFRSLWTGLRSLMKSMAAALRRCLASMTVAEFIHSQEISYCDC